MGERTNRNCDISEPDAIAGDGGTGVVRVMHGATAPRINHELGSHLESVRRRVQRDCALLPAAKAVVKAYIEHHESESRPPRPDGTIDRDAGELQRRAERADGYAKAATVIAVAALGLA